MTRPDGSRILLGLLVVAQCTCIGCTSTQLRRSTVAHSTTLADIYTQQVVNNLAMFVQNPSALPFFAFPNQGTTSIQDTGNVGNLGYVTEHFQSSPFTLAASRQATENWVLVPVSDPAKLGLMRCAYQQVLASCGLHGPVSLNDCPNCRRLRRDFYGPTDMEQRDPHFNENLPCLDSDCWFCWGCKKDVPVDCCGPYVGCYCGLYLWVPPQGREMLTRLTLTILDYAVNDPVQFSKRTKEVELYLNQYGTIISEEQAKTAKGVRKITATIPIDEPSDVLAALDQSPAYVDFLKEFGKRTADELQRRGEALGGIPSQFAGEGGEAREHAFWRTYPVDRFVAGEEQVRPGAWVKVPGLQPRPDLAEPLAFVQRHGILPRLVPSDDFLRKSGVFERKGAASAGLQALQQRLTAASPP